ncbi:DNA methyltransferase [Staphylococcus simulans]|uniref:DNA methyltransferase n=1 Tax=Staphylococcus simulans TaxID=1286 RepID=UPI0021D18376|nr:site-specific DNA-methyltransferase [Staphylococcus simulans]UXR50035.1 site-specific DNA-methyltransferase [Staphylococcus simulans]
MSTNLLNEIFEILKGIKRYWKNEKLVKQLVIEDLRNNDRELISELLSSQTIKEIYVLDIDGHKIFDKESFISMLRFKNYWQDSYTKYGNKIGLSTDGRYLNYNTDVVLDFPFKDCILEGGMTKEDSVFKNEEKFYNEIIAKDEIDTLLAPKVFTNIKKYNENGENNISEISSDDNLIIKGNNLVALHSLKKRYAGKVKMIFIDPPYNMGEDSFKYNDKFSQATWLTFMKNRLTVAKELLSEDGVILIQISFHQYPYLRVLMDESEVFGVRKHLLDITTLVRNPLRSLTSDKKFNDVTEFTLIYSKSDRYVMPKLEKVKKIDEYVYDIELNDTPDEVVNFDNKTINVYFPKSYKVSKKSPSIELRKVVSIRGSIKEKNSSGRFYVKNIEPLKSKYPPETLFLVPDMGDDSFGHRLFSTPKDGRKNGYYYQGKPKSSDITSIPYPNFLDMVKEYNNVNYEGVYEFRNGKKPEALIKYYLEMFTKPNDLVLDFFMGSGTTQATSHKLNRQYIGIEQMDYINSISSPRLQRVIEGEDGGISKEIEWQGGGSFVYAELAKENQKFIEMIVSSNTKDELKKQMDVLLNEGILNYEVDFDRFTNTKKEFSELTLEEQKEVMIRILDINQLYVNYSEIEDSSYNFSKEEIDFNHSFYGGE